MIIFDLDGTLWDTTYTTLEAANIIANKYDEVKEFKMKTITDGMGLSFDENVKNYFPYLEYDKGAKYLDELINTNIGIMSNKGAKLYDGVEDVIKELSKKYKLGIITNNNDDYVKVFYKASKLEQYFTDYMGAATYGITKAEAIRKMVDRNNEENSYYVGDIEKDMLAAHTAGIGFIHAKYGFDKQLSSTYYIEDIKELPKLLINIK